MLALNETESMCHGEQWGVGRRNWQSCTKIAESTEADGRIFHCSIEAFTAAGILYEVKV